MTSRNVVAAGSAADTTTTDAFTSLVATLLKG
jgi:hypothetical protein